MGTTTISSVVLLRGAVIGVRMVIPIVFICVPARYVPVLALPVLAPPALRLFLLLILLLFLPPRPPPTPPQMMNNTPTSIMD